MDKIIIIIQDIMFYTSCPIYAWIIMLSIKSALVSLRVCNNYYMVTSPLEFNVLTAIKQTVGCTLLLMHRLACDI